MVTDMGMGMDMDMVDTDISTGMADMDTASIIMVNLTMCTRETVTTSSSMATRDIVEITISSLKTIIITGKDEAHTMKIARAVDAVAAIRMITEDVHKTAKLHVPHISAEEINRSMYQMRKPGVELLAFSLYSIHFQNSLAAISSE